MKLLNDKCSACAACTACVACGPSPIEGINTENLFLAYHLQ